MKNSKANNYGRGFYFTFADGYTGWVMGFSARECKAEERIHGKLIKWVAA